MKTQTAKEFFFTQLPTPFLVFDPVIDEVLEANDSALEFLNINAEEMIGSTLSSYFIGCLGELISFTQQIIDKKDGVTHKLFTWVEKRKIPLEVRGKLLSEKLVAFNFYEKQMLSLNKSNKGQSFDITRWNKKKSAFKEIERQNQLLLKAVGDGIYGVDSNGHTTFVNDAAESILGWKREELIGAKIHDIIHHSHESGECYLAGDCPIYAAFHDGAVHFVDDEVFWSKSGKPISVEYTSTPVTDEGVLVGAVVIFRDVTNRKKTESKLLEALAEVEQLKERLESENAYLIEEINSEFNHKQIIGKSPVIQRVIRQVELVGPTSSNVLINGESGTGKELLARAIHEVSDRKERPLIKVNCAAIPGELFESEFFGHVKGAFSGAMSDRLGRFTLADGGTIFLDEVGEIPLHLQSKLLRVLQEGQFEKVGASVTETVDVRVISATNKNLKKLVEQNKFREDLYYRLDVFPIESPSLRQRTEDIPLLLNHFIRKCCKKLNLSEPKVSKLQVEQLQSYAWPGNIRELENVVERQLILSQNGRIDFSFASASKDLNQVEPKNKLPELVGEEERKKLEKLNIEMALELSKGKLHGDDGAATLLGVKPTTLNSRIRKLKIDKGKFKK